MVAGIPFDSVAAIGRIVKFCKGAMGMTDIAHLRCFICGSPMVREGVRSWCPRQEDPMAHPESTPAAKLEELEAWLDQAHSNWRYDFNEWQMFGVREPRR